MFSVENITVFTLIIYLLATVFGFAGLGLRKSVIKSLGCKLALVAFCCQTITLVLGYHKLMQPGLSLGAYLQMLAWFTLFCGIGAWWRLGHEVILLFAAPFGMILFLMSAPALHVRLELPQFLSSSFYALHVGVLFLSIGLLALASIAGIIFLALQKRIKSRKKLTGFWNDMPAITILDKINAICSLAVFPLYTLGLIAGFFWSAGVFGKTINADPKQIISLVIWLLMAVLFHNRLAKNWKGKKPAILIIIIFILSLFSFFIVNFYMPTQHDFIHG